MKLRPIARLVAVFIASLSLLQEAHAQSVTLIEGPSLSQLTVRILNPWTGASKVLLQNASITPIDKTARTINDASELRSTRRITRYGLQRLEGASATRLFSYERSGFDEHGLLLVPTNGAAQIVYSSSNELESPIAVSPDGSHAAFADDSELVIIDLHRGNFPSTGQPWRTVTMSSSIEEESVMVGKTHVFFVCDDSCVYRCALADGNVPQDITPATSGYGQSDEMAMSGDGTAIAFLRGSSESVIEVWFAQSTGPALLMNMPPREYREVSYLPEEDGIPRLALNEDGSRLLVTEIQAEDEILYIDTNNANAALHVTGDVRFSPYIGVHVLPGFIANTLVMASGHAGWMDWYATRPDGTVINLTETGSSEAPFLVGSLDVLGRYPLGNDTFLATEALGAMSRLRIVDPAGSTTLMFSDLIEPPSVGSSFTGQADLRVVTQTGQHIVLGTNGAVRLSVPAPITLTDPLRSTDGFIATYASIPGAFGVPILMLPDGRNLFGMRSTTVPQMSFSHSGDLHLLWPTQFELLSITGRNVLPLPASPNRNTISGAGG